MYNKARDSNCVVLIISALHSSRLFRPFEYSIHSVGSLMQINMLVNFIYSYISLYVFAVFAYTVMQIFFAQKNSKKQNSFKALNEKESDLSVTVIIPCYNEDPKLLEACLKSIQNQKILGKLNTIIVDDGSKNIKQLLPVLNKYKKLANFDVFIFKKNQGKRFAQKLGFDKATGEIIVTIDSDTIIDPINGINNILKQFASPKVGAATGDVKVLNKNENYLTRLILYRYWIAFNQERAAQSNFSSVMCCSGPFSAYRTSIINKIKEQYISQTFLGAISTYGDDRHLTNLVLQEGHAVRFEKNAIAYTHVPNNIRSYIKQQIRWNKSFYRELLWTLRNVPTAHLYMVYDMIMQLVLPYMSLITMALIIYTAVFINLNMAILFMASLFLISTNRLFYAIYRTGDFGFLLFTTYSFIHVIFLMPSRLYALSTLKENGWSTR